MATEPFYKTDHPQCCLTLDPEDETWLSDGEETLLRDEFRSITAEEEEIARSMLLLNSLQPVETFPLHDHVDTNNMPALCKSLIEMTLKDRCEDVNMLDSKGNTALFLAVMMGRRDALKLLLQFKNIDLHIQCGSNKFTALMAAILTRNRDFLIRLYNAGAR